MCDHGAFTHYGIVEKRHNINIQSLFTQPTILTKEFLKKQTTKIMYFQNHFNQTPFIANY